MPYDLEPRYPVVGGELEIGYDALAEHAARVSGVLAIDGPGALDWARFIEALVASIQGRGVRVRPIDVRSRMRQWSEIVRRTETALLRDDTVFAAVPSGTLGDLFATPRGHAGP
jgi:hypothetical protein